MSHMHMHMHTQESYTTSCCGVLSQISLCIAVLFHLMASLFWERKRIGVCVSVCVCGRCGISQHFDLAFDFQVRPLIFNVFPTAPSPLCPEAVILSPIITYPHPVSYLLMFPPPVFEPNRESDVGHHCQLYKNYSFELCDIMKFVT